VPDADDQEQHHERSVDGAVVFLGHAEQDPNFGTSHTAPPSCHSSDTRYLRTSSLPL
jgi:hypothetical protein